MTKNQRYKYEMLVRVRDYGMAHQDVFPESSSGGERFLQVSAAVAAIDDYLKARILGRAEARRVKATTRAAVFDYMKTIAQAARRVTRSESGQTPFRMPRRRSLKVDILTARAFIEEAARRVDQFVEIGLPATFISDFTTLVDQLQTAVDTRLSSKTVRGEAQAGIAVELARGFDVVLDLDVVVAVAARENPVLAAAWRSARRIEGQGVRPSSTDDTVDASPDVGDDGEPVVSGETDTAAPGAAPAPDGPTPAPLVLAPLQATVEVVGRSS